MIRCKQVKKYLYSENNKQDPQIVFEMKKKRKFKKTKEFATRIKEVHKEAKAILKRS